MYLWKVLPFCLVSLLPAALSLENGLSITPAMGWNPYNAFRCDTTESQYRNAAQSLIDLGLSDLGYNYVNVDCGWQGTTRDPDGGFTWDRRIMPSGVSALSEFVHSLGLKFGLYSDAGYFACDFVGGTAHYIGSLHHETADALTFAEWGADYLKYDNCYAVNETDFVNFHPPIEIKPHFEIMRDAIAATGRDILYSACEWGVQDPARWPGTEVANSWRISNDISASWNDIVRIINQVVPITGFAGPGGWNDLDMLEVGNSGLTLVEQQTHFAFWAAVKSPLLISTDLSAITNEELAILKNERIIALNQDPLGEPVSFKRRYADDHDVWAGPLKDGSTVAVIINWQDRSRSLTFALSDVGFSSAIAENLLTGEALGRINSTYIARVEPHGILVLKLSRASVVPFPSFTFYEAAATSNTLRGGARVRKTSDGLSVVGFIGNGGTLTINGIDVGPTPGEKLVTIDYINGDYHFTNTDCSNCRNAFISVNGGELIKIQTPVSAENWDILFSGFNVSLPGFVEGNSNTIEILNPDAWTPDIYRIGVETAV